ncbi:DNA-binding transcriptional regulator [Myxosarcina sp. GI1]|uniref:helix-turn-helix domain-containing protein n=1 Tax=Myxosarcina sp. GI1 TaxID=1541065 RepID=UPI001C0FAE72|nr:helix-turn-helix domain-containing protein [Myxosarcina sp. GI1]
MPAVLMEILKIKKLKQPFVGQLIRELRQVSGLTQEELANSLEVSFSSISRWERGKTKPSSAASKLIETKLTELGERGEELRLAIA